MVPLRNNPSALTLPQSDTVRQAENELAAAEALLVETELRVATLRQMLAAFERKYLRAVAGLCKQLDDLNARIAELCADCVDLHQPSRCSPTPPDQVDQHEVPDMSPQDNGFVPSESLSRLYRDAAKLFHPDLAEDDADREWRTQMMQKVNAAYAAADCATLSALVAGGWKSPATTVGDSTLTTLQKKLSRVRARLDEVLREEADLKGSDLGQLYSQAQRSGNEQTTFLRNLVIALKTEIHETRKLLKDIVEKGTST